MTTVLRDPDVSELATAAEYIEALEEGFRELGLGRALSRPRTDSSVATSNEDLIYKFKSMDGVLPSERVAAIRINSDTIKFITAHGQRRQIKEPPYNGLHVSFVLLFSTENGELLAILPDRHIQRMRVGCTSGLGAKYLARADASRLAVIGSGWQAGAQVMAMCAVRPIREIRVFSPNPEHRARFAKEVGSMTELKITPSADMESALRGADIVALATNSRDQFLGWEHLEPGMHLTTIRWPNVRSEVFYRAHRTITNQRPPAYWKPVKNQYAYVHAYTADGVETTYSGDPRLDPSNPEYLDFAAFPSLGELVAGKITGRQEESDITFHANNVGLGLQFAAVGKLIYRKARERGLGLEIPSEYFTSYQPPQSAG